VLRTVQELRPTSRRLDCFSDAAFAIIVTAHVDRQLAASPLISIPTITMEGDANGALHPHPNAYANKFSGKCEHRTITGGIGHNLHSPMPS
jgi:hypothetical protein